MKAPNWMLPKDRRKKRKPQETVTESIASHNGWSPMWPVADEFEIRFQERIEEMMSPEAMEKRRKAIERIVKRYTESSGPH